MKTRDLALSFGLVAGLFATNMAFGQGRPPCADRNTVIERLTSGYGETVRSMGLGANNGVVEVFASNETGTWTITVTLPNGTTCLVAAGIAFEHVAEALPPAGTPS